MGGGPYNRSFLPLKNQMFGPCYTLYATRCTLHAVRYTLHLSAAKWSYRWSSLIRSIKTANQPTGQPAGYAQHHLLPTRMAIKIFNSIESQLRHKLEIAPASHPQQNEAIAPPTTYAGHWNFNSAASQLCHGLGAWAMSLFVMATHRPAILAS